MATKKKAATPQSLTSGKTAEVSHGADANMKWLKKCQAHRAKRQAELRGK